MAISVQLSFRQHFGNNGIDTGKMISCVVKFKDVFSGLI